MKLKNFMFATMIACAFASCSEDDAIIDNGPDQATGSFTINVATSDVITKAATLQSADETIINDFTVHVYRVGADTDGNKTYTWVAKASHTTGFVSLTEAEIRGNSLAASALEVKDLPLNETYVCYGYANLGKNAPSVNDTRFGATAVVEIPPVDGFEAESLPMVGPSQEQLFDGDPDKPYIVKLERSVSRVDIVGLNLDADAGTNFKADKASFKLTDISINGVTTKVNHGANGITAIADASTWGWMPTNTAPWNNAVANNIFFHNTYAGVMVENEATKPATAIKWGSDISASVKAPAASYYILPNPTTTNKVNIALQGEFGYTKGTNAVAPVASTYAITLADQGTLEAKGVLENNKLYSVDITVAGPGSLGKAALMVAASVSDYQLKAQSVVVE